MFSELTPKWPFVKPAVKIALGATSAGALLAGCTESPALAEKPSSVVSCRVEKAFMGPGPNLAFNILISSPTDYRLQNIATFWGDESAPDEGTTVQHSFPNAGTYDVKVIASYVSNTGTPHTADCYDKTIISTGDSIRSANS